ncbi:MAG: winged helix-turn-helix domain-containing protein [Archaeoglobaceae archaeon]
MLEEGYHWRGTKILLNRKRFSILRLLNRKYNASELAKTLNLSIPMLYHLSLLETHGYIKRVDTGNKWVYYELTEKGSKIMLKLLKSLLAMFLAVTVVFLAFLARKSSQGALGAEKSIAVFILAAFVLLVASYSIWKLVRA